jgi:hypothetical protein
LSAQQAASRDLGKDLINTFNKKKDGFWVCLELLAPQQQKTYLQVQKRLIITIVSETYTKKGKLERTSELTELKK